MSVALTLLSTALWWVLYGSIAALGCALIGWCVLRWTERTPVVFNRLYLACLVWALVTLVSLAVVAAIEGRLQPPYGPLLRSGLFRVVLVLDMLFGAYAIWRLTPRIDAHRVRIGSACMAAGAAMAVAFGVATSFA